MDRFHTRYKRTLQEVPRFGKPSPGLNFFARKRYQNERILKEVNEIRV